MVDVNSIIERAFRNVQARLKNQSKVISKYQRRVENRNKLYMKLRRLGRKL
ncbi:hypothetical protein [Clostridium novyi]|uniref:hypothetical protein n=1 Tax=Clostridium novyi TaxID=1542 RepID=UPI000AC1D5C6|nr:hypothetical protein [Clostridium novyi]